MTDVKNWIDSGKYLPEIMRDFHDQKDLFKSIHDLINVNGHEYAKSVDWVSGQCYVIDIFLWFMAHHGYTLQKSRKKCDFDDLYTAIQESKLKRMAVFTKKMENQS